MTNTRFLPGDHVRIIGSPGFTGVLVRYYKPMPSGKCNVLVQWDRHGDSGMPTSILESQLETSD